MKVLATYTIELNEIDNYSGKVYGLRIQRPYDVHLNLGGFRRKEAAEEHLHEILSSGPSYTNQLHYLFSKVDQLEKSLSLLLKAKQKKVKK